MLVLIDTTPTPIPLSQVGAQVSELTQRSQQFYDTVLQYGALGILGLFVFLLILVVLAVMLYLYTTRNRKTGNSAEQAALSLGNIAVALQEQLVQERKDRAEQAGRFLEQQQKQEEREIESLSAITAAQESVRQLVKEIKGLFDSSITKDNERDQRFAALNANIAQIIGEGSEPVQNIQGMVANIRDELRELSSAVKEQKQSIDYAAIKDTLQPAFTEVIAVIREQKRITDKIPVIAKETGNTTP